MLSNLLKTTTAPLHKQLEDTLFSAAIMNGSFTLANYQVLLRVNYLIHSLLEPVIFSLLEDTRPELRLSERRKLHALEADMRASGIDFNTDKHLAVNTPFLKNEGEALGALYVLEGATLGGQVIIKRLKKDPVFSLLPLAYYNVYADQTGTLWKQFLEALNQYEDHDSVLSGAEKVYHLYLKVADDIINDQNR